MLVAKSSLFTILSKCTKPIFKHSDDIRDVAHGIVEISPFFGSNEVKRLMPPLRKFARRDPALIVSSFDTTSLNYDLPGDGRKLAVVLRAIPSSYGNDAFWKMAITAAQEGLSRKIWRVQDCHWIANSISKYGGYEKNFIDTLSEYIRHHIATGLPKEFPHIFMILSSVQELKDSDLVLQACNKAAVEGLSVSSIGQICYCLNRMQYVHHNFAIAIQEEADRIAESSELFSAVNVFFFIARHEAQHISTESLQWLAESLMTGQMDRDTVITVCSALGALPKQVRKSMRQELTEIIIYLSGQVLELLDLSVGEGGMKGEQSMEMVQIFVSKFVHVWKFMPLNDAEEEIPPPDEYVAACSKCALVVHQYAEQLVSDENPPFSLIPHLLNSPIKETRESGVAVLKEMAKQAVHIPSLQTFRFVLLMGDHKIVDKYVFTYLRNQFAKTSTDIPIVQLCTALKCFVPGLSDSGDTENLKLEDQVERELEAEQTEAFFRYVKEKLLKNVALGVDFRCIIAVVDTLLQLGCKDDQFFESMVSYMSAKSKTVAPADQSSEAAASIIMRLGKDILLKHKDVQELLEKIVAEGRKEEISLSPSEWMDLHDPAHALLPLTEEQKEGWKVIDAMVLTRADDRSALIELAKKYISLLPQLRPDDSKYFFGVFEEKVLKEDKLLKQCLEELISTGIVTKLSATTIAAILHSLSMVRFVYSRTVKEFLHAISEEQWSIMEAAPLVHLLGGIAKLSMRIPSVLDHIGRRIHEIHRFMSPFDVAQSIHSLQALGFKDDAILMELMQHASSSARSFDDASLSLLFAAPSIHRLLRKPELALPLLQRATRASLSVRARERVVRCLGKSPLPRELINSTSTDLLALETPKEALRLTQT
eukprot:gene4438-3237_t